MIDNLVVQEYFEDWWESNFKGTYNSEYEESYRELAYYVWQHQQSKIDKLTEEMELCWGPI